MIPRASRSAVAGTRGDAMVVRIAAAPVDNAANQALIEFLAATLNVPRRAVRIVAGEKSRDKRVAIDGVTARRIAECLPIS